MNFRKWAIGSKISLRAKDCWRSTRGWVEYGQRMGGWALDGRMDTWMDGWMDRWMYVCMYDQLGLIDHKMDGIIDGLMMSTENDCWESISRMDGCG